MNGDRSVVEFVQSGRSRTDAAADARVLAAMASAGRPDAADQRSPRPPWRLAAAVLVGGIAVVSAVAVLQRQRDLRQLQEPGQREVQETRQQPPQGPAEPAAPAPTRRVDAATVLQKAPVIAVFSLAQAPAAGAAGCAATVLRVVQGDLRPGQQVWLHCNPSGIDRELACTDAIDLAAAAALAASAPQDLPPFLLALAPVDAAAKRAAVPAPDERAAALPWLRPAFGCGLPAMPASRAIAAGDGGVRGADAGAAARLLAELDACLADADDRVRAAGVQACGSWDAAASPWRDASRQARLLSMADDPSAAVRSALAASLPAALGDAGRAALLRLAFDRFAQIRFDAVARLRWQQLQDRQQHDKQPIPDLLDGLASPSSLWPLFTLPGSQQDWLQRCRQKAVQEGIAGDTGAFLRQLDKGSAANLLLGAFGLGLGEDRSVLPRLAALQEHEDGCVRAAAAWARVRLGDRDGYALLRQQACSDDVKAAVPALDMLRSLDGKEALDALVLAARAPLPAARALAAAGLPALRPLAPHQVDAVLGDLRADAAAIVRLAAGGR